MISIVINRSDVKVFQSSAFARGVKRAVQEYLPEPYVANDAARRTIDIPSLTVPVVGLFRNGIEKCFLEKAEINRDRNLSNKPDNGHNTRVEDKLPP